MNNLVTHETRVDFVREKLRTATRIQYSLLHIWSDVQMLGRDFFGSFLQQLHIFFHHFFNKVLGTVSGPGNFTLATWEDEFLSGSACIVWLQPHTLKWIFGSQPSLFFIFWGLPNNWSTSVGRKYRGSMRTRTLPVSLHFPTSSTPVPSQLRIGLLQQRLTTNNRHDSNRERIPTQ